MAIRPQTQIQTLTQTQAAFAAVIFAALTACVPAAAPEGPPDAAADFAAYCAACHGASGGGDGPASAGLAKRPANLTRLAARSGGTFPTTRVMAQIWGYAGGKGRWVMPDFAPLLDGETVPYDGGDGIDSPTPHRLVALAEYLKALQK